METVTTVEIIAAVAIALGIVGIVLPILPGALLIAGGLVGWAISDGSAVAWLWAGVGLAILVIGQVVKYLIPGKRLKAAGVPNQTLIVGGLLAIVGFFVVPVVGLFVGFVLGVYLAELERVGSEKAWPSTWAATKAVGLSILIELVSGLFAAICFVAGLLLT
ncbi:MAG: DUF456 domain-containing protein [Aeromicrobium sp.]|uniref:DUF456 domain-containing protein n=1 Tax=Aeromicrobium sp. TaxID=1871063 RepID=UPI0039E47081